MARLRNEEHENSRKIEEINKVTDMRRAER
jgi:hypothetical protein